MGWDEFDNNYNIMLDYLNEYQIHAMNAMIYVWYGMTLDAFIDSVLD